MSWSQCLEPVLRSCWQCRREALCGELNLNAASLLVVKRRRSLVWRAPVAAPPPTLQRWAASA